MNRSNRLFRRHLNTIGTRHLTTRKANFNSENIYRASWLDNYIAPDGTSPAQLPPDGMIIRTSRILKSGGEIATRFINFDNQTLHDLFDFSNAFRASHVFRVKNRRNNSIVSHSYSIADIDKVLRNVQLNTGARLSHLNETLTNGVTVATEYMIEDSKKRNKRLRSPFHLTCNHSVLKQQ